MIDSKKLKFVDGSTFQECYSYWEKEIKKATREGDFKRVRKIHLTIEDIKQAEMEALKKAQRNFFNNEVVDFLISLITLSFLNFSARKLIGGTIRISLVCYLYSSLGTEGRVHAESDLLAFFTDDPSSIGYGLLTSFIIMIIGIYGVYLFVRGFYLVFTFQHEEVPMFSRMTSEQRAYSGVSNRGEYKNIKEAYAFRDYKMRQMSTSKAIDLLMETNSMLGSCTDRSILNHLDSKLGTMGSNDQLNFLRGK